MAESIRTIKREIVSAVIESSDGKIFMGKKDPNGGGVYPNAWHIPGGGVEGTETFEEALAREIFEETGIDVATGTIELLDDKGSGESLKTLPSGEKVLAQMHFNVFKVNLKTPADQVIVNLTDDLVEYHWFSRAEMQAAELTPPSVSLFTRTGYLGK